MKSKPNTSFRRRNPCDSNRGVALVFVLAMLVLMLGLTLAFFSAASAQRMIRASSNANWSVDFLARAAEQLVIHDLLQEIEAGSETDNWVGIPGNPHRNIHRPVTTLIRAGGTQEAALRASPAMVPQSAGVAAGAVPLLKKSRRSVPFFRADLPGYREGAANGPARAADVSTDAPAVGGQTISRNIWAGPRLLDESAYRSFLTGEGATPPDWIYLDRRGASPTEFSPALRLPEATNLNRVIGRFAYTIYDVGGLLDINVIGNALANPDDNAARGALHQVNPDLVPGGVGTGWMRNFVTGWRSPATSANMDVLFDPGQNNIGVHEGNQTLLGRRDWIDYAGANNVPTGALQLFSTFTRELNAPYWEADVDRPRNAQDAVRLNPPILSTRFDGETLLRRGGAGSLTVPSGTPVLPRRFPLAKLDLLENYTPDRADEVRYYFGLENQGRGQWKYVVGVEETDSTGNYAGTRIADLQEVAALGREPNFFETLQAVLLTDSLGKHAGDAILESEARDSLRNLQVLQIGANIIDQWDADDIPTTLEFPSGAADDTVEIYGVENLPYINNFATTPFRPTYDRDLFQVWLLFDLWNPHQNAFQPPTGVGPDLRIVINAPSSDAPWAVLLTWVGNPGTFVPDSQYRGINNMARLWDKLQRERPEFIIPAFITPQSGDPGYLEPRDVTIGGGRPQEPTSPNSTPPGLLLVEYDLRMRPTGNGTRPSTAGIVPKEHRSRLQQEGALNGGAPAGLNRLLEAVPGMAYEHQGSFSINAAGDRVFPAGARLRNVQSPYWACDPPLPPEEADGWSTLQVETRVWADFPVFAYNHLQFSFGDLEIALQAFVDGQWRTYQKMERFQGNAVIGANIVDAPELFQNATDVAALFSKTTQHSEPNADMSSSFYTWRKWFDTNPPLDSISWGGYVHTHSRMDPRSLRFGVSRSLIDGIAFSTRSTTAPWNATSSDIRDWIIARGTRAGFTSGNVPINGFQAVPRPNGQPSSGSAIGGVVTNHPTELNGSHPLRYPDRDGVIRPADGFWGALPTLPGRDQQRPLILNRPFRSVGELGYVFRDLPWKTLDFSSRYSADLGLLDFFSIEDTEDSVPVLAGRVNLNLASEDVLTALLAGTAERPAGTSAGNAGEMMTEARARVIAQRIVAERQANGPYLSRGDLVARVFHHPEAAHPFGTQIPIVKAEREAAIRTLSGVGNLRTWNLLIDLVVQDGKFGPASSSMNDFLVQSTRRYWIHVALDRITGEVLDLQREVVEIQ
jgi:hypothetical protein